MAIWFDRLSHTPFRWLHRLELVRIPDLRVLRYGARCRFLRHDEFFWLLSIQIQEERDVIDAHIYI